MTTAIALYAAVISTAALAIELVSQWRTWATRVRVTVKRMERLAAGGSPEPIVLFTIANHSGHPVKITHLGMEPIRRGGHHLFFPQPLPLGVPGPFEVPPRDSITLYQPPKSLADGDPNHKTRAIVATSDGKTFNSPKVRVGELTSD